MPDDYGGIGDTASQKLAGIRSEKYVFQRFRTDGRYQQLRLKMLQDT